MMMMLMMIIYSLLVIFFLRVLLDLPVWADSDNGMHNGRKCRIADAIENDRETEEGGEVSI